MPKTPTPPPATPSSARGHDPQLSDANVAAIVEAAYILEAARR